MFTDICFPQGNEEAFIQIAERLGTRSLCFAYPGPMNIRRLSAKINLFYAFTNEKYHKEGLIISKNVSRQQIENPNIHLLYGFEGIEAKDSFHSRKSGLNQVLCELISNKKKLIGISFSDLLNSEKKQLLIGRIMQNARLARKYDCSIYIGSFAKTPFELRAERELKSVAACFGLNPLEVKSSCSSLTNALKQKETFL